MTTPQFDAEGLFTDDYLYFFADHLEERSDAETDLIWRLLELQPAWRSWTWPVATAGSPTGWPGGLPGHRPGLHGALP